MRGRQQAHAKIGVQVMEDFFKIVEDVSAQDKKPTTEGRSIIMILTPKKQAATIQEKPASQPAKSVEQSLKPAAQTGKPATVQSAKISAQTDKKQLTEAVQKPLQPKSSNKTK